MARCVVSFLNEYKFDKLAIVLNIAKAIGYLGSTSALFSRIDHAAQYSVAHPNEPWCAYITMKNYLMGIVIWDRPDNDEEHLDIAFLASIQSIFFADILAMESIHQVNSKRRLLRITMDRSNTGYTVHHSMLYPLTRHKPAILDAQELRSADKVIKFTEEDIIYPNSPPGIKVDMGGGMLFPNSNGVNKNSLTRLEMNARYDCFSFKNPKNAEYVIQEVQNGHRKIEIVENDVPYVFYIIRILTDSSEENKNYRFLIGDIGSPSSHTNKE
jgi:hypothetical protein